jgi:hypothetical protein
LLWEHLVLNELHAHLQSRDIRYWRDKRNHEVDFILARSPGSPSAIECKWSASDFDASNLQAFRRVYPRGDNFLVANDVERPFTRSYGEASVHVVGLRDLIGSVVSKPRQRSH